MLNVFHEYSSLERMVAWMMQLERDDKSELTGSESIINSAGAEGPGLL